MNAELLIRLIKAFYNGKKDVVDRTIQQIILDENKKKHYKLAQKLKEIVNKENKISNNINKENLEGYEKKFLELPRNPRNNQPLATIIPHNILRHHMILNYKTEQRLNRIEKEYTARKRLAKYNLKPKKKILLYGAPGCGKTMGAERIAWNIGLPVIKVNFDTLISSFLGETSSNLRTVFNMSKDFPSVLLLDECDIIAKSRLIKQDVGEMSRIVNMLLMLLDEFAGDGIVIATTNLEDALDKAIYRRFDDIIEIKKPSKEEIEKLLELTLSSIPKTNNINWNKIINELYGSSSASIVTFAENAAKISILNGEKSISNDSFNEALNEIYKITEKNLYS